MFSMPRMSEGYGEKSEELCRTREFVSLPSRRFATREWEAKVAPLHGVKSIPCADGSYVEGER